MKSNQKIVLVIISLILFTACTKEIKIDIPHTPLLALNMSNLTGNDEKLYLQGSVSISKKLSDNSYGYDVVNNAQVGVYEGTQFIENLWVDTFLFTGTYRSALGNLQENKTYTLKVKANGYNEVEATDKMPSKVPITATITRNAKGFVIPEYSSGTTMCDEIVLTFNDDASNADYYGFTLNRGSNGYGYLLFDADAETNNGESSPDQISVLRYGNFFYKDVNFNGKQKTITVYFPNNGTNDNYYLEFKHLSENLYKYQVSFSKYQETNSNPFADPVKIFSNVKNGAGIFGLQQIVKDTL